MGTVYGQLRGFLLAFPIAGLLAGYAMEQFQNTKSVLIGALLLFAGQFIILGLGLFWYRAIIPVEESMLASVERLLPGSVHQNCIWRTGTRADSALGRCRPQIPKLETPMNTMRLSFLVGGVFALAAGLSSCGGEAPADSAKTQAILDMKRATDHHSYSRPEEAVVTHLNWNAAVDFDTRVITATATYDIEAAADAERMIFDCTDLTIQAVRVDGEAVDFELGPAQRFIGQPLSFPVSGDSRQVSIDYQSSPEAGALLWVEGDNPFLFTQSQAILARTWIPCQDSPGIRFTYEAHVDVPQGTMALMSATNPTVQSADGHYDFRMDQKIPSYLLALAGNVEFRSVGEHTGVYAVPELIEAAAYEFAEMEDLLVAAENLYGKYAWDRYDLLVLPPAFPFGGMENPRLTFATPTIIAGDRSLVSLVAHELAHSWSGNLVTNATWDDFWLNEGFTVYFEQRIMESVYGRDVSEMLATLSYQGLVDEVDAIMDLNPDDTHLKLHLQNRDPDDGLTAIAYDKGYFFFAPNRRGCRSRGLRQFPEDLLRHARVLGHGHRPLHRLPQVGAPHFRRAAGCCGPRCLDFRPWIA